jgi:hypothetical protein
MREQGYLGRPNLLNVAPGTTAQIMIFKIQGVKKYCCRERLGLSRSGAVIYPFSARLPIIEAGTDFWMPPLDDRNLAT